MLVCLINTSCLSQAIQTNSSLFITTRVLWLPIIKIAVMCFQGRFPLKSKPFMQLCLLVKKQVLYRHQEKPQHHSSKTALFKMCKWSSVPRKTAPTSNNSVLRCFHLWQIQIVCCQTGFNWRFNLSESLKLDFLRSRSINSNLPICDPTKRLKMCSFASGELNEPFCVVQRTLDIM